MRVSAKDEASQKMLDELNGALAADQVRFELVRTFGQGDAIRVEHKVYGGRWKVVKTLLFPPKGESIASVFSMLVEMRGEATS